MEYRMDIKTQEILCILQEECAEVIQAVSKINRFGADSMNDHMGVSNREALVKEIGDVIAMIYCISNISDFVTEDELIEASDAKLEKLKQWSNIFKD
jgi:NTP pyrophosphatase (non-canonical NTP hydrolase)